MAHNPQHHLMWYNELNISKKSWEKFESRAKDVNYHKPIKVKVQDYPNQKQITARMDYNISILKILRTPMVVGVCLGLIPIQGVIFGSEAKFRYFHYRSFITLLVAISIFLHTIAIAQNFFKDIIWNRNSAGDLVLKFSGVWFYSVGTFAYVYFLIRSKEICIYFKRWDEISKKISTILVPDRQLNKKVALVTALVFLDCIGENIFYHIHAMGVDQRGNVRLSEFLEVYYASNQYMAEIVNYDPFLALVMLITNKLATYAWNFIDITLIVICMALKERFWALNQYMERLIDKDSGPAIRIRKGVVSWSSVRTTFHMLREMLHEANKLLIPLIWISYTTDVFFVCRQLYELFSPRPYQKTPLNQIYMIWSFVHLMARTLAVYLMASFVNEEAHRTFKVLQYCHPDEFNDEVRRLEQFLGNNVIGITGNGCFTITRSFVLMIISGIFTLEVVLLQNAHLTF